MIRKEPGLSVRALRMMRRAFCSALEVTVQVFITRISAAAGQGIRLKPPALKDAAIASLSS
jgi:hypothetical protein